MSQNSVKGSEINVFKGAKMLVIECVHLLHQQLLFCAALKLTMNLCVIVKEKVKMTKIRTNV